MLVALFTSAIVSLLVDFSHPHALQQRHINHYMQVRRGRPASCAAQQNEYEIPLYDPLSDEVPFPFPSGSCLNGQTFRYLFSRPVHLRMLREACGSDEGLTKTEVATDEAPPIIGHCVMVGSGPAVGSLALGSESIVRSGTVGVALHLTEVAFGKRSDQQVSSASFLDDTCHLFNTAHNNALGVGRTCTGCSFVRRGRSRARSSCFSFPSEGDHRHDTVPSCAC